MENGGACGNGSQIDQDSPFISKYGGNLYEYSLAHGIIGTDVEQINGAKFMKSNIKEGSSQATQKITKGTVFECLPGISGTLFQTCRQSYADEQNVPGIGVDSQRGIGVVHAAGVEKNKDAAEQAVIHQKG